MHRRVACWFLLPNFIGYVLFTAWPVIGSLLLSFSAWDLLTPPRWVGFDNFFNLLGFRYENSAWSANDPNFWKYLRNTLFLMLSLPINMAGALGLALMLNRKLPGIYVYRLVFFFPSILSGIAIFYLWRWIYNPHYGLANVLLGLVGVEGPNWLGDATWVKPALMLMGAWLAVGGSSMVLYLAALQNVSVELHEAAHIDGANPWQRFWVVTWPSIRPVTFFIFTMGIIHGLQSGFDAAYVMTQGGPFGSSMTIGYYIYSTAYTKFEMGYASAIAWVLFIIVLAITAYNWRRNRALEAE